MGKLSLGLGLGVGYVLGTRAGRARFEQIKQAASGFMGRPQVQQALEKAKTAAPAPLHDSIEKLSQRASGGQGTTAGTSDGGGTDGGGTDGGGTDVPDTPLPNPVTPPAKSGD